MPYGLYKEYYWLKIKSRRQPKANIGTVEKVLEGIWRL